MNQLSREGTRSPKMSQEDRYKLLANKAMELSSEYSGTVTLVPLYNVVKEEIPGTNGSYLRQYSYPEIIEMQTGLTIIHNGLVLVEKEID
jgi:hypothetical protein